MTRNDPAYDGVDTGGYFKPRSRFPGWAKGCLAAGCGCVVVLTAAAWFSGWSVLRVWKSASENAPAVVEPFLDAVDAGDYDRARTLIGEGWRQRTPPEAMRAELARIHESLGRRTGPLAQHGVNVQVADGKRRTTATYRATYENGDATIHATTVAENGVTVLDDVRFEAEALLVPGTCPSCGAPYAPDDRFCSRCGANLPRSP